MGKRVWKVIEIIFYIIVVVWFLIQSANLILNGLSRESLVIFSELIIILVFGASYYLREKIKSLFEKLPLGFRFVIIGYLSCAIAETAYIFSKPLHQNLGWDLILTAPWYILWMISWYFVLKKYDFSTKEAFYLAGFHGFVIEGLFGAGYLFNPILLLSSIVILPLLTFIYSCFFIVPYFITKEDFGKREKIGLGKKILISLIPLLMYLIGFIWILIIVKIFGLTLH